jgi:hypothetical protein
MSVVAIIADIVSVITAIKRIHDEVEGNKEICSLLSNRLERIVPSLQSLSKDPRLYKGDNLEKILLGLKGFIDEVNKFINKFKDKHYFSKVFNRNTDNSTFEEYNQRLTYFIESLQLGINVNRKLESQENELACQKDFESMKTMMIAMMKEQNSNQEALAATLASMERNHLITIEIVRKLSAEGLNGSSIEIKLGDMESHLMQIKEQIRELLQPELLQLSSSSNANNKKYQDLKRINHKDITRDKEIGRGAYGNVFKGKLGGNYDVAIKTVSDEIMKKKGIDIVLEEVQREAMILQLLDSPYVIRFYGAQLEKQFPIAIVMELGICSLDEVLHPSDPSQFHFRNAIGNEPLNLMNKINVMCCICDALDYIHKLDIIHRDLKPLNILICKDGNPKIIDFGLSKDMNSSKYSTIGGGPKGTYSYMAPELFQVETRLYSQSTDVYAFGVTANEIISETRPFDNKADVDVLSSMIESKGKDRFKDIFSATSDQHVFAFNSAVGGGSCGVGDATRGRVSGDGILTELESLISSYHVGILTHQLDLLIEFCLRELKG